MVTLLAHTKSLILSDRLSVSKSIWFFEDLAKWVIVRGVHLTATKPAKACPSESSPANSRGFPD